MRTRVAVKQENGSPLPACSDADQTIRRFDRGELKVSKHQISMNDTYVGAFPLNDQLSIKFPITYVERSSTER